MWLNWDLGASHFNKNLVVSDWAVNSGNWLWVSSSAFEHILNCQCLHRFCTVRQATRIVRRLH